jgi:transketolase
MRKTFCETMVNHAARKDFVFLTGDLGFNALEPLRDKAGDRFINAGVAEQNMVSVAAGLAQQGFRPWAYSIAPFLFARPLEQVRNDLCLHSLPVALVGNGGGYGYGVMGGSHHAIEDYGILLSLPAMKVFVPAFASDLPAMVESILRADHPSYLRLGKDERPKDLEIPPYAPWRKVLSGGGATVVIVGPLAGPILKAFQALPEAKRPKTWLLSELPLATLPEEFLKDLEASGHWMVVEEHVAHGGAGEALSRRLLLEGKAPKRFSHACAQGYLSGYYGSQDFHRAESGLSAEAVLKALQ